ncbi:hypothetical protein MW887_006410 [Aspergillus wentii]|nr:hypothetical protein MW887_006410 [Aspergillus wentii]
MNRFRKAKKEKVKEVKETKEVKEVREETEPAAENPFTLLGSMSSKKKKEEPEEEKPDLDLSAALPSSDDFRTSLLMPKLSARFSMLREQDDPASMIGKASDDSVLFPKRASRLNLFGHNPGFLKDIDEVSMDGSRPSFALNRADSYVSSADGGYGTDDDRSQAGSMMSRGRRTEGNNLFGGRQKVYKIPANLPSNPDSGRSGMGGRALYDHDVNMSAFQRLRRKEKEERAAAEETALDSPTQESEDGLSRFSSANRTTYSSTMSGPTANARTSTAATSVDEQFAPPQTQTPSLGQNLSPKPSLSNMAPERGSARSRRLYGQGLAQSVQNQQNSTLHRLESLSRQRAGTPELPQLNRTHSRSATNLRDRLQKLAIAEPGTTSRPTSPPPSASSPNQVTMESEAKGSKLSPGHGAPPLSPPISENEEGAALAAALQPEDHGKATAMGLFNKPRTQFNESQFTRRQLQMHQDQGRSTPPLSRPSPPPNRPTFQERSRGFSDASYRSRTNSASSHYSEAQRTVDYFSLNASPARAANGTFFATSSASESGDDDRDSRDISLSMNGIHPALRDNHSTPSSLTEEPEEKENPLPEVRYSDLGDLKPIAETESVEHTDVPDVKEPIPEKPDSPTLGPSGLGLSGLVRTHLRHNSDRSSIFLPPSPSFPPQQPDAHPANSTMEPEASSHGGETTPSAGESARTSEDLAFQEEIKFGHRREASTETQKEREDFERELAERRRKVQEKLKGFAESESRSGSPVPGNHTPEFPHTKPGNAFALLKNKSGKNNLHKPEQKNGKVLGLGNSSTPALVPDDPWHEEEEIMPFNLGKHSNSSSPQIAPEKTSMRSRLASITRGSNDDSRESSRSRGASPHTSFRRRDRSGSDASASGRSKSRNRYREKDHLGALDEGAAVSHETLVFPDFNETRGAASVPASTRPSMEASESGVYDRSSSASGRLRSGSRSATSSYHDKPPCPQQPANPPPVIGELPRPSPIAPYSANATPPLYEISPEPSTTPTPTFAAAASHVVPQRAPGHHALPKRPVNKLQISEPTFLSCTSNVPTVGLPPGASLSNGMETPPIPPMNPRRRRQTTTQTIISTLKGGKHDSYYSHTSDQASTAEQSSFEDESDRRPKSRARLRKTSSEGGSLNARARQEIMASPPPGLPPNPPQNIRIEEGGMF